MPTQTSRRQAIKTAASGLAIGTVASLPARAASPNDKLNLACIGVGGRGWANVKGVKDENMVAFVDVDEKRASEAFKVFPQVPTIH